MTVLGFTIRFHGPFRVGAAYARDGMDAALDKHDPLPADHIKGVMRAAAVTLLGEHSPAVLAGVRLACGPVALVLVISRARWRAVDVRRRHRVAIDPEAHSAIKDHLVLGEHAWAPSARFEITRAGDPRPRRPPGNRSRPASPLRSGRSAWPGRVASARPGLGRDCPRRRTVGSADVRCLLGLAQPLSREAGE